MRDAHDKIQEVMYNELSAFATEAKFAHLWMSKGFKTTHISSPFIYTVHARVGKQEADILFYCVVGCSVTEYTAFFTFTNSLTITTYLLLLFQFPLHTCHR